MCKGYKHIMVEEQIKIYEYLASGESITHFTLNFDVIMALLKSEIIWHPLV